MWKTILQTVLTFILETVIKMAKKALPLLEEIVLEEARNLLEQATDFISNDTFDEAKVKLIDKAFERIKLPLVIRPFKGLIKKAIYSKVDEALEGMLRELKEKLNK